jgi:hypothetical protein
MVVTIEELTFHYELENEAVEEDNKDHVPKNKCEDELQGEPSPVATMQDLVNRATPTGEECMSPQPRHNESSMHPRCAGAVREVNRMAHWLGGGRCQVGQKQHSFYIMFSQLSLMVYVTAFSGRYLPYEAFCSTNILNNVQGENEA